jgi:hypothetical protein
MQGKGTRNFTMYICTLRSHPFQIPLQISNFAEHICKKFIGKKAENFAVFTLDKLQEFHASFPKTFYEHSYANSYAQLEKFCFSSYQLHIKLNKNWNGDPVSSINIRYFTFFFPNHMHIKLTASTRMLA